MIFPCKNDAPNEALGPDMVASGILCCPVVEMSLDRRAAFCGSTPLLLKARCLRSSSSSVSCRLSTARRRYRTTRATQ